MLHAELMHDLEVSVQITMDYSMHMIHFVKKDIPTLFKTIKWYEQLKKEFIVKFISFTIR